MLNAVTSRTDAVYKCTNTTKPPTVPVEVQLSYQTESKAHHTTKFRHHLKIHDHRVVKLWDSVCVPILDLI